MRGLVFHLLDRRVDQTLLESLGDRVLLRDDELLLLDLPLQLLNLELLLLLIDLILHHGLGRVRLERRDALGL